MDTSAYPRGLQFNLPQQSQQAPAQAPGGMFGNSKFGIGQAIVAALNGDLAGTGNPVGMANIQMMQQMRERLAQRQQDLSDYNRKRADDNTDFQSHRQYEINNPIPQQPDDFESALAASGVQPGTPQWTQAMQSRVSNILDPVVMTPQGPMLRSQVLSGAPSGAPAPSGVTFTPLPAQGGQTPPASGGFLGGPYSDVGPYHRY